MRTVTKTKQKMITVKYRGATASIEKVNNEIWRWYVNITFNAAASKRVGVTGMSLGSNRWTLRGVEKYILTEIDAAYAQPSQ